MQAVDTSVGTSLTPDPSLEAISLEVRGRTFRYYLSKAVNPATAPMLVIFHGHGFGGVPTAFQSENWNVVRPMDQFGADAWGSWYLGEGGDYFWLEAFPAILQSARDLCSGGGALYCWGSSMGGYASILHGTLNRARAIYANVPQTRLLGSTYSETSMKRFFEPIFGESEDRRYNDLRSLFKAPRKTTYFLCFNQLESGDYFAEQGLRFINHLQATGNKFYLEVRPTDAHGKNHGITETIRLFNKYR